MLLTYHLGNILRVEENNPDDTSMRCKYARYDSNSMSDRPAGTIGDEREGFYGIRENIHSNLAV